MAHWRLTPKQISRLSEDDLDSMSLSYRMYEKRWLESLSDLIGSLTGTSWNVDSLTTDEKSDDVDDFKFTWSKRPTRQRVSLPLTVVVGGNKILEHVKKVAHDIKAKERRDPSILSLPSSSMLHDAEIVDLSRVPKDQFIRVARSLARTPPTE